MTHDWSALDPDFSADDVWTSSRAVVGLSVLGRALSRFLWRLSDEDRARTRSVLSAVQAHRAEIRATGLPRRLETVQLKRDVVYEVPAALRGADQSYRELAEGLIVVWLPPSGATKAVMLDGALKLSECIPEIRSARTFLVPAQDQDRVIQGPTSHLQRIVQISVDLVEQIRPRNVLFVGLSKGGTSCLSAAVPVAALRDPPSRVAVLALSPALASLHPTPPFIDFFSTFLDFARQSAFRAREAGDGRLRSAVDWAFEHARTVLTCSTFANLGLDDPETVRAIAEDLEEEWAPVSSLRSLKEYRLLDNADDETVRLNVVLPFGAELRRNPERLCGRAVFSFNDAWSDVPRGYTWLLESCPELRPVMLKSASHAVGQAGESWRADGAMIRRLTLELFPVSPDHFVAPALGAEQVRAGANAEAGATDELRRLGIEDRLIVVDGDELFPEGPSPRPRPSGALPTTSLLLDESDDDGLMPEVRGSLIRRLDHALLAAFRLKIDTLLRRVEALGGQYAEAVSWTRGSSAPPAEVTFSLAEALVKRGLPCDAFFDMLEELDPREDSTPERRAERRALREIFARRRRYGR